MRPQIVPLDARRAETELPFEAQPTTVPSRPRRHGQHYRGHSGSGVF